MVSTIRKEVKQHYTGLISFRIRFKLILKKNHAIFPCNRENKGHFAWNNHSTVKLSPGSDLWIYYFRLSLPVDVLFKYNKVDLLIKAHVKVGMFSYVLKEVLQSIGPSSQNHTHKSGNQYVRSKKY